MRKIIGLAAAACAAAGSAGCSGDSTPACQGADFAHTFTGAPQTFTVPAGIGAVVIEAWGAEGNAASAAGGGTGGLGGYATGTMAVTAGQNLTVVVGGRNGYNGGGAG